jgi:thymidylate kinase
MNKFETVATPEQRFLTAFFNFLKAEKAEYAVIRNYETLPETVPGTDIDLVIRQADFKRIRSRLAGVAAGTGYRVWKVFPKNWNIIHVKFAPQNCLNSQEIVKIDFMLNGLKWLGYDLMSRQTLLDYTCDQNGIRVLKNPASTLLTLLNSLTYSGQVKAKYRREFSALPDNERAWIVQGLNKNFGRYAVQLAESLSGEGSFNFNRLKRAFVLQRKSEWFHLLTGAYFFISSTFLRVISPPGEFVVVVGPDGTGKSSLVDKVEDQCVRMYKRLLRFHFFPRLKLFSKIDRKSFSKYESRLVQGSEWENRQKKISPLASLARCIYHLFRFWAGYLFWIYPERVMGSLVVGERWCYDWLIDPQSKGVALPLWVRRMLYGLCPKPDKVIVVRCSPETAERRKGELPAEEIRRQMMLIDRYIVLGRRARVLQNDGSLDDGFCKLLNLLLGIK